MFSANPIRPSRRRYEFAVAGLFMLMAAFYFGYAVLWSSVQQWNAHSSFVTVRATIVEASVRSTGNGAATGGRTFFPHIVYRYSVGGKEYENDRYFFAGDGWRDASSAGAVVARFPAGSSAQVFVDASSPSQAVIDANMPTFGALLYLLPFFAFAVGVIAYGLRGQGGR
jgi:hypothetical protein